MQYFGGKVLVSKEISKFLNNELKEGQPFIDLFCGSCNIINKIEGDRIKLANDKHKYLIAFWKKLQDGWDIPVNMTKEKYYNIR